MTLWIDAHLSPALGGWIQETFGVAAVHLREIGLRDADDREIYSAARAAGVVVMTKDSDFVDLLDRYGPPPQVLWLPVGILPTVLCESYLLPPSWKPCDCSRLENRL